MWAVFLILILLAESEHWVRFEVCQMDLSTVPHTMRRQRDHDTFTVRANHIVAVGRILPKTQGIQCAKIETNGNRRVFVIGTVDSILEKLSTPRL